MSVTEIRILRWMCGKNRRKIIRNESIHKMVRVAPIRDKLRKHSLVAYNDGRYTRWQIRLLKLLLMEKLGEGEDKN